MLLLPDAGSVSHEKAMDKAEKEYRKYQAKTLSGVEVAFLESVKGLEKKVSKKTKVKTARFKK